MSVLGSSIALLSGQKPPFRHAHACADLLHASGSRLSRVCLLTNALMHALQMQRIEGAAACARPQSMPLAVEIWRMPDQWLHAGCWCRLCIAALAGVPVTWSTWSPRLLWWPRSASSRP